IFHFKANGFLRGQIRLSVASVLKVLEGKMSEKELKEQIEAKKVNFNAGTTGACMVEGRISSSAIVGEGSDVGGGASILGVLSGT
ncbi:hypothetical protein VWN47_10335, partial [Campylobacter jejuni]